MEQMTRKVLITGGLGLIGKELIYKLSKKKLKLTIIELGSAIKRNKNFINNIQNTNISFIKCNILDLKKLEKFSKEHDSLIHLAAMLGVENTENNIKKCWDINALGTQNVISACNKNKIKKLIFTSSSEVYGESATNKINENNKLFGRNIYACSKIAAENMIFNNRLLNSNFNFTILRVFNTYGLGQVAKFFIPKICKAARENKKIIINGNGNQIRGYAFASDIADAIVLSLFKKISKHKIYNVGNSKEKYSLKEVIQVINKIVKVNKNKIIYDKKYVFNDRLEEREIYNRVCDLKKIRKDLSYSPKVTLKEGLKKVLDKKNIIRSTW